MFIHTRVGFGVFQKIGIFRVTILHPAYNERKEAHEICGHKLDAIEKARWFISKKENTSCFHSASKLRHPWMIQVLLKLVT